VERDARSFCQPGQLEALRALAIQIGWDVRWKYDTAGAAWKLTLWQPTRTGAAVSNTFTASQYSEISEARIDIADVRNVVKVIYWDRATTTRLALTLAATDLADTSITTYGRRFMEISEAATSNIDSSVEATTLATACLRDLMNPVLNLSVVLPFGYPWAEPGDYYTFQANSRIFSGDQSLSSQGVRHSTKSPGRLETSFQLQGAPSFKPHRWLSMETRAGKEKHTLQGFQETSGIVATASSVVGGTKVTLSGGATGGGGNDKPARAQFPEQTDIHISTSAGFTASSSNLVATTQSRSVVLADLIPGTTYYMQHIVRARNGSQLVPGLPSTETSFVAGQAQALHLNAELDLTSLPLNGSFETWLASSVSPDHWTGDLSLARVSSSAGTSGRYHADIATGGSPTTLYSAYFPVKASRRYRFSMWAKGDSGTHSWLPKISWCTYDTNHESYSATLTIPSDTAAWTEFSLVEAAPSSARFGRVVIPSNGTSGDSILIDKILVEPWHEDWIAPTYVNSWVDYAGGHFAGGYYKDSATGRVHLRGLIKTGTVAANAFVLPAGYRPSATCRFVCDTNGGGGVCTIDSSGNVYVAAGSNVYFCLDQISFGVE
jgi:hypothetical protein